MQRHQDNVHPDRRGLRGLVPAILLLAACGAATALLPARVESVGLGADIVEGAKLFRTDCAVCHGKNATGARGPDLTRGRFRHGTDDAALFRVIAMGISGSPMPGALSNHSAPAVWQLVAYIRSLNPVPVATGFTGSVAAGKNLFEQRGRCLTCHLVDGRGACLGPDLSDIGRERTTASLRLSIVEPSAEVDPAWWSVKVVDASGVVHTGRRMDEDTYFVRLLDDRGQLRTFERAGVRSIESTKTSTMPDYGHQLTPAEIDEVVAYLSTLARR